MRTERIPNYGKLGSTVVFTPRSWRRRFESRKGLRKVYMKTLAPVIHFNWGQLAPDIFTLLKDPTNN